MFVVCTIHTAIMSLASGVIKLAAIRMGDLIQTAPADSAAQPAQVPGGYVPPHLRSKDAPQALPTFTDKEFPSMAAAPVAKKTGINFKEMMKAQEEKEKEEQARAASENTERQQMIDDGWVFLSLKDAKKIAQRW